MKSGISLDKDYVPSGGDYRRFESKISDSHSSNFRRHAKVHSFRDRLKIVFTNARSIRKNFAEFTVLLEDLKPDVFGITESWLREDIDSAEVSHPGYVVYRQDRRDTHNGVGGGVLLYVRDDIGDNILDLVLSSNPSNVVDLTGLGKLGTSDHDILAFDVVCKVVIMENHVPWKNRRRKSSMPHWMNKKVRCAIRQKRRMWKLFRRTKSESLLAKFKIHQLKVECLVSDAKLNFEKSIALKIKDNPKAFFSYVR
ncbi:hypothetical protein BSL78_24371 [Apostichopus japonicus]|uniref:Endonuclease/exonuclease/phosphatase domain-containing protein n=1 Tax=Stichopus japonicus TaxID=307972 RepID=A0A2G8JST1_STIJA|nr:hypothetical protein BSL78_24371 [Apostichopus japonicus]